MGGVETFSDLQVKVRTDHKDTILGGDMVGVGGVGGSRGDFM